MNKSRISAKVFLQDWLEDYGYELGYNNDDRKPEIEDMDWIVEDKWKARHYFNYPLRTMHIDFLKLTGRKN
jgi:hypothetical protein|tara:strand:+ start:1637 stop:1849 length:213 start_codon:yes stop_codon:yes gene_type:complete